MGGEWRRLCHWWSASQLPGLQFHGLPMLSNAFQLSIRKFNVDKRLTSTCTAKLVNSFPSTIFCMLVKNRDKDDEFDLVTAKGIPVGHLQEAVAATLR